MGAPALGRVLRWHGAADGYALPLTNDTRLIDADP